MSEASVYGRRREGTRLSARLGPLKEALRRVRSPADEPLDLWDPRGLPDPISIAMRTAPRWWERWFAP